MSKYQHAYDLYERMRTNHSHSAAIQSPKGVNHMSIVPEVISEALRFINEGGNK
ncbi:hypothetical protein [Ornithinibacillus gellani]|uniref:hypothetical protein n=1 Tax=Ornithinibacillus gellani TaxID=2293253 RepID=UPI001680EA30|nr:hypothetical protein [Ornithinibacillus gellani]